MRVAIVHDWLTNLGGGERVVEALSEAFPEAPIYTSVYDPAGIDLFDTKEVRSSFLQSWPMAKSRHQLYPMLRRYAFESFDLSTYDVVISSSSAEAKGVITNTNTLHISYIHTPTRYYWSGYQDYVNSPGLGLFNPLARTVLPRVVKDMRRWDFAAAQRADHLVANSKTVQERISKYYKRDSQIIFPPVEADRFNASDNEEDGDYYLVVSRLIPYKRVDLAVLACSELNKQLVVVGDGSELAKLRKMASNNVEFIDSANDKLVAELYSKCKALIFTAYEDFGIVPVEAMASGTPVIAYGYGGASESVIDSQTGVFFNTQSVESLKEAIYRFEQLKFSKSTIRKHAKKFSKTRFIREITDLVNDKYEQKYSKQTK